MSASHFDVAIMGGGLVGTSAALWLRQAGLSVVLFEKGVCGAQASGVNYGGVRRQGRPPEQIALSQRAHALWPELANHIGIDGEFRRTGHLKLARSEADFAALEAYAARVADLGLDLEMLSANALHARFGWLGPRLAGASFCAGDGHANPRLVSAGFAAAARRAGAVIHEETAVSRFTREAEGFRLRAWAAKRGEREAELHVRAGVLVNAAGAWGDRFAQMAGEPVPLERIYPSMIVTEPVAPLVTVNIGMEGGGIYARQVERGNVIVGGERGEARPDADFSRPTGEGARSIMARTAEMFPGLAHAQAIRFWSGTEGAMPDRNPVLGPSEALPGLIHAFGFTGAGFQLAPGVGQVIADLARFGRTDTPIDAFSIRRFVPAAMIDRTTTGSGAAPTPEPQPQGA